ncbi:MAG: CBS domain-containing protein [Longimicrobiales bacterium]|nr:CBS domain-containing protein [Longimicrobiales bacterium]
MRLSELLVDAWAAPSLEVGDLAGALKDIMGRVAATGIVEGAQAEKIARDLSFGAQGEVVRLNQDVVAVLGSLDRLPALSLAIGIARQPFLVTAEGLPSPGEASAIILVLVPGRLTGVKRDLLPVLTRVLREPERTARLLRARTLEDLRGFQELMETEFQTRLRVEDALTPVRYRVYPETPLEEVVDLMVRRGIHAVPVVGHRYEVLGILTSGDALEFLLRRGGRGEGGAGRGGTAEQAARDFMTRTVLCVSEEQPLTEAAHMMVHRDVEQLPVVRDGELVGFVTRDSILRALSGAPGPEQPEDQGRKSIS